MTVDFLLSPLPLLFVMELILMGYLSIKVVCVSTLQAVSRKEKCFLSPIQARPGEVSGKELSE